jgi:hypothetical protein
MERFQEDFAAQVFLSFDAGAPFFLRKKKAVYGKEKSSLAPDGAKDLRFKRRHLGKSLAQKKHFGLCGAKTTFFPQGLSFAKERAYALSPNPLPAAGSCILAH